MVKKKISPFNSSLETGVRSLTILVAAFPETLDLQRIVEYEYLTVHSGDAGGPESLHAPLPLRTGEILVRRGLIESGLLLMASRHLIEQIPSGKGIRYVATESAGAFLNNLNSSYIKRLMERAVWVSEKFKNVSDDDLLDMTRKIFDQWTTQFQPIEKIPGRKL